MSAESPQSERKFEAGARANAGRRLTATGGNSATKDYDLINFITISAFTTQSRIPGSSRGDAI
jgi:hypothetical protein